RVPDVIQRAGHGERDLQETKAARERGLGGVTRPLGVVTAQDGDGALLAQQLDEGLGLHGLLLAIRSVPGRSSRAVWCPSSPAAWGWASAGCAGSAFGRCVR